MSLSQAVNFCIDRGVIIPKTVELMADEIERLKIKVTETLKNVNWTKPQSRDGGLNQKDIVGVGVADDR